MEGIKPVGSVAVYSITRNLLALTQRSFSTLRRFAGVPFDHYVADNGSKDGTQDWLVDEMEAGRIKSIYLSKENLGQNIAANILLDFMENPGYEWIMRWDPDAIARSRRFMRKMVRVAERLVKAGDPCLVSPKITKLKKPPEAVYRGNDLHDGNGKRVLYEVVNILGGICRLHPSTFFADEDRDQWRFNQYGARGFGEALEVADRCDDLKWGMVRLLGVEVEHAHGEDGQEKRWPESFTFEHRGINRYVSYGIVP